MGNKNEFLISNNFSKTCHLKLRQATINNQEGTLQLVTPYDKYYHQWKWNLYPIMSYQKHLFLPLYFKDQALIFTACQVSQKDQLVTNGILVGYGPYIYTLQNQIITRKLTNRSFSNKQVWKLMKYVMLALKDWTHAYPNLEIGRICPKNIVFNSKGLTQIVHMFSFPPDNFIHLNGETLSYSQVNPERALRFKKSNSQQQILTQSLRQLGITLFSMITLFEQGLQVSETKAKNNGINWRFQMLKCGNVSEQLLQVILGMINCQTLIRKQEELNEIIRIASQQSKSKK